MSTLRDTLTLGAYTARFLTLHPVTGTHTLAYSGPDMRHTVIRTMTEADRAEILHALNDAYERGREDARREIREALGVAR